MSTIEFHVRKDAVGTTRLLERPDEALAADQVRLRIEHFAYTANNITYAAFGEALHYWEFFPVPPGADGLAWGCIPVWGFGQVVQSRHDGVAVGERLYGYWPMASHAVLQPARAGATGFVDGAAHRAALPAAYNRYLYCRTDPFYTPDSEELQAVLRPLFVTAWLIDDFLADNHYFGATAGATRPLMLLSSASSKTAWATAAQLARRAEVEVVGLTSSANRAFCESLGVYGRALAYEQLDGLPAECPCVYVDFAGNGELRKAVHTRFVNLAYSCAIGGTHVDQRGGGRDLPGPKPVFFFAPTQAGKRSADWGPDEFNRRLLDAWHGLRRQVGDPAAPWIVVHRHCGGDAVQAAHALVLGGRGDPREGHMLSLAAPD